MKEKTISVRIQDADIARIDAFIKKEYPKIKTVSQVIREALSKFFQEN
jgi:Arc/MetJ-type ribon-helix-helix transcriptional regulator